MTSLPGEEAGVLQVSDGPAALRCAGSVKHTALSSRGAHKPLKISGRLGMGE